MCQSGLKKGAVTPLALLADKDHKIELVLDKAMMDLGRATPMLYHPISGNTSSVAMTTTDLERYLATSGHESDIIDFTLAQD